MQTYLVGGAVRDGLLQRPITERDWVVVGATPEDMLAKGFQQVGKDFPVFLHPHTHEEYALARTERKSGTGHTGFICHSNPSVTLEEDLLRRDLTINAMAQNEDGTLIDPFQGQQDIEARVLRHVSPAFSEDPLRVLRVARFMAQLGEWDFHIAPATLTLMQALCDSGELATLPKERLWKECEKALHVRHADRFFLTLQQVKAPFFATLGETHLSRLRHACEHNASGPVRFAALCYDAPDALQAITPPKAYLTLARLCQKYLTDITNTPSAEALLQTLHAIDAYRRPARLQDFIAVAAIVFPQSRHAELQHAYDKTQALRVTDKNLTGKAIGEALYQLRLTELKRYTARHFR